MPSLDTWDAIQAGSRARVTGQGFDLLDHSKFPAHLGEGLQTLA
jgi:hypothetical protein